MVGSDEDQGIIGVLLLELHGSLHGVAHLQHIVDGSSGIVCMAGPVDLTALGHEEEALGVIQQLDALFHVVGQLPLACGGIHGIVHGLAVGQILGNDQGLACACGQCGSTRLPVPSPFTFWNSPPAKYSKPEFASSTPIW